MIRPGFSFLAAVLIANALPADDATRHFDTRIGPLLARRCLACHNSSERKGGLDLTSRERATAGGESGPSLVTPRPQESLLWQRVQADEMPPDNPLTPTEKSLLRDWIAAGAAWGETSLTPFQFTTEQRGGYDWWSLQPLAEVTPPEVNHGDWIRGDVDRFILHQLETNQLAPAPPADPRTLVRRLSFDLIGLPPAPELVAAFANDPSDAAYRQLLDDLLDSPRHGERWGRHWLDVARYGETDGFESNRLRKSIWHYRDWVIGALNDDMPYDQFVWKQIAGDLEDHGRDGAAAVGFLVAGVHNTVVGKSERMKRLARQDELEEIIGAVGQAFLGLTLNCARCHDHKFDPIRTEEYYALIAAIDGVQHGEREFPRSDMAELLERATAKRDDLHRRRVQIDGLARTKILATRKNHASEIQHPTRPEPYARWEFEGDLRDSVGNLHGKAVDTARVENGALVVDGTCFVETAPLDRDLAEKTLEAWVLLDNLEQRARGTITVQASDGSLFDSIVFGEVEPGRWTAGSNGQLRTQSFFGTEETEAAAQPVHLAIVYRKNGTISGYRHGRPYGSSYTTDFQGYMAGQSQVLFGVRHNPGVGNRFLTGKILRAQLYDRALSPREVAASATADIDYVSENTLVDSLSEQERAARANLEVEFAAARRQVTTLDVQARGKVYTVKAEKPGTMRVHVRGSVTDYGREVAPGGVGAIAGVDGNFELANDAPDAQRRRKLADWVSHPANPLLARVIVNRVWHYHFGSGLVETPSDLGFNGGRPSHPELIDWLATGLRANGFRLKWLHRILVTSAAYRQSSAMNEAAFTKDADNRLLWRHAPRRVEAEVLRDSMLLVAGVLNHTPGGPGFEDVQIQRHGGTTYYTPFDPEGEEFHRRTVYRFTPRGGQSSILNTFDCPDPSTATPRRSVTTTPLQALSLMNNSFVLRMADHLARRLETESGQETTAQIERAWQLTFGRAPSNRESQLAAELVSKHGLPSLCRGLFNSNEFVVIQ